MKAIFLGCLVAVFASCTKPTIDSNFSISPGTLTEVYSWGGGGFDIKIDSSNWVKAGITADGVSSVFSAAALSASFSRNIYSTNGDSSLVSISAFDINTSTSIRVDLINIPGVGTYSTGYPAGQHTGVLASCTVGNYYYSDVLSGSVTIDTLTANRIHGMFTVTCGNGIKTVEISNGSFAGNL